MIRYDDDENSYVVIHIHVQVLQMQRSTKLAFALSSGKELRERVVTQLFIIIFFFFIHSLVMQVSN